MCASSKSEQNGDGTGQQIQDQVGVTDKEKNSD